jgi:hypothetical protein
MEMKQLNGYEIEFYSEEEALMHLSIFGRNDVNYVVMPKFRK